MFGSKEETNTPVVGGTEEEDISTVQESVPVPYVVGTRKVAGRWISNVYNQYTVEVKADTGKKGGSGKKGGAADTGVYDYYGSLAAAACNGAVDELVAISIDGEQRWADPDGDANRATYPDKYVGTIAGYGTFHFYWGTDTQTLATGDVDAGGSILLAANNDKGEGHPNYRGTAFIELRDFLFGREKVSAPSIEIVVRRKPVQNLVSGASTTYDDEQVNPLTAVVELMTNDRYGLGMEDTEFDSSSFQDTADYLATNKDLTYCSPFLNKQAVLRSSLSDLASLTDSFLKWDPSSALIQAGYWTHDDSVDTDLLPILIDEDQTEPPKLTSQGWSGVKTGWDVSFADRERQYKESSEKFDELSLIKLTGQPNRESLSRNWLTRRAQALAHAVEWAKNRSRPYFGGTITVRRRSLEGIEVGDLFMLDIDAEPSGAQLNQPFRMLEKSYTPSGPVTCKVEAETNLTPVPYTPPPVLIEDDTGFPEPPVLTYVRPMEMPISYSGVDYGVAVLAQREDNLTVGYGVLYDDDNVTGDFPSLGSQRFFAVYSELSGTFSDTAKGADEVGYDPATDAPNVDITLSNELDLFNLPDDLGLLAARDDQLVLILAEIDNSTGQIKLDGDGYANMEMLSVSAITTNPDTTRRIQALRGRYSTGKRSFPIDPANTVEAWLIRNSGLEIYSHEDFAGAATAQTDSYFKTEPFNVFQTRDISTDGEETFLFAQNRFFAPKIALTTTPTNGFVGVPLQIEGTITDQDGDLASWSLSYRVAGAGTQDEVSVRSEPLDPTTSYPFLVPVTILSSGSYEIVIRAKDSTSFTDGFVELVVPITVSITQSAISAPTGLATQTAFKAIWLSWTNPTDESFDSVQILESTTNDSTTAEVVLTTGAEFTAYAVEDSDTHYFWIRSKDRAGNVSAISPGQTSGVSGTARLLITNADDVLANEIIANTANIADAVITAAKIISLTADKITAGTIGAEEIILGGANSILKSSNYSETDGWLIEGNGDAKFSNLEVRQNSVVGTGGDGLIEGDIANTNAYVQSPDFEEDVTSYPVVKIFIKRSAGADVNGMFWFQTSSEASWTTDKQLSFTSADTTTDFKEYTLDMSTVTKWTGNVTKLRIDPEPTATSGSFQIGYVRIEDTLGSILKQYSFPYNEEGWTASAQVANFAWDTGQDNVLRSANYVPGVSGWAAYGNGVLEVADLIVYGKVPTPQLYIGGTVVQGGFFIEEVDVLVASVGDVTVRYRTDGTVPDGSVSDSVVPASPNNYITISANTDVVLMAFETTTGRTSEPLYAPFRISRPLAVGGLTPFEWYYRVRSYYDTEYMLIQRDNDDPTTGTWVALQKKTYYRNSGIVDGFVYEDTVDMEPTSLELDKDFIYCHSTSTSINDRIGPIYRNIHDIREIAPPHFDWDANIETWNGTSWDVVESGAPSGERDPDDYPYTSS